MKSIAVRSARAGDIDEIVRIARSYPRMNRYEHESSVGFLVSDYQASDYLKHLDSASIFLVALESNKIVGFLLSYPCTETEDISIKERIAAYKHDKCILIKQICVDADTAGKGVGKTLYEHLFSIYPGYIFFAAIVTRPRNLASIKFHENLGFGNLFSFTPEDGIERGMWKL
ncbi:MAG: GNAT family N-acetyltransferase [Candidatus Thiodiazotropha sp.]